MSVAGALIALSLLGLVVAALGWWHSRAESARLTRRLRTATSELENLQNAFSRFAPDPVVERVIAFVREQVPGTTAEPIDIER